MLERKLRLPKDKSDVVLSIKGNKVRLTNLPKPFWPEDEITKGDLLQYYADVAPYLLPHLRDRAMVMKRYPHGYAGEFFFMKRTPSPKPEWLQTCAIEHASGNIIEFPVIQDLAALLWVVNLGCIDLNPWYARCDDVDRPDYLHFDLDPVTATAGHKSIRFEKVLDVALIVHELLIDLDPVDERADFKKVIETALVVHQELDAFKLPNYAKTTGSRGIHVYVPIVRGPLQKEVWTFAKNFAVAVAQKYSNLITSEYRIAKRPKEHVLVDYNQNAWGRTLASVYSVRPKPQAPVSAPLTWDELEREPRMEEFRLENMPHRLKSRGDLWKPMLAKRGRFDLRPLLSQLKAA